MDESSRFVRALLEISQAIVYVYDVATDRTVYISDRGAAQLGYRPADVVGQDWSFVERLLHPADRDTVRTRLAALAARPEGTVAELEYRLRHADGGWRQVLDRQILLERRPDGGVQVLGNALDVTARRDVEAELQTVSARLATLLHDSATVLFRCTPAAPFVVTFVTDNVASVLGWSADAITNRPLFLAGSIHPDDAGTVERTVAAIAARGFGTLEFRLRAPDGTYRWLRDVLRVVRDADGRPKELAGSCVDITEHKRVEEQLRRTERLAAIGTLAAGIAHEINNPAAAIVMSAELALASDPQPATVRRCLHDIVSEGKRCGGIVKGILQFTRAEPTEKRQTDLNLLVRRVAEHLRAWLRERRVRLATRLAGDLPLVLANPVQIEQVVANLVRNGVEAGGRHVVVATSADAEREVRLVVEDDGHGIEAEARARIFDPFFTTRQARGGTGLGLSMCHGIVIEHGGRIEVAAAPAGGTLMVVSLPAAAPGV